MKLKSKGYIFFRLYYILEAWQALIAQQKFCGLNISEILIFSCSLSMLVLLQMAFWMNCYLQNLIQLFCSGNREMAYLQSVVSAGIMFHVTRACESGDVFDCGCDKRYPETTPPGEWTWGGCSDNIRYGMYFTREFVDASKDGERAFDAMTKHNYEAGRQVN